MIKSALILDLFFKQLFFNNIFKKKINNICLKILIIFIKKNPMFLWVDTGRFKSLDGAIDYSYT